MPVPAESTARARRRASSAGFERSGCPIANVLDLLGDKWTLLVVRDLLLFDRHRFGELEGSAESIPTNLLAERLERLRKARVVSRRRYQANPPRYEYHLTRKGRDLLPVLREMARWAFRHVAGLHGPPVELVRRLEG